MSNIKPGSHKLRIFFSILIIGLVAFYITRVFSFNITEVVTLLRKISPASIIISTILALGHFYLRAISWSYLISAFGIKTNIYTRIRYWFFGEITRYIPGKVWSFASRGYFLKEAGASREKVIIITALDIFLLFSITTLLSLPSIIQNIHLFIFNKNNLLFTAGVFIVISLLAFFFLKKFKNKFLEIIGNLKKSKPSTKKLAISIVLLLFSWVFFGALIIYLISIFQPVNPSFKLFSDAIFSWLIGFAGSISPTGLGIREGAIIFLFTPYTTPVVAGLVALSSRLVLVVTEVVNILFLVVLKRLFNTFDQDGRSFK